MLLPVGLKIFLALGYTDMRKSINGLSIIVEQWLSFSSVSGDLFVFCNRSKTIIKILYWDNNGFCLWQKRLEKHFFRWPHSENDVMAIKNRELRWLIDGLDINTVSAHGSLLYSGVS